ncbi:MAG TPA: sulfurtransferase [Candidatus Limnocylindrales bacterium]|nr:sulfurtransferase [Candidatus Limnocylindrales bacterium]
MALTGFSRPELLATAEWLSEQLSRDAVRIVDVRWRPDGTAAHAFEAGHIPGAVHLDWRAELTTTPPEDEGPALHLAGPEAVATAFGRAGIGDGTTVVLYDDTLSLYAAWTWWALRVYGFESARILDGGFTSWQASRRSVSTASLPHAAVTFTPHLSSRLRLTTTDVRATLGSPDVQLLDARAAAEYRGFEGNARRLGHIPGAVNVPVGAMHERGSQALRDPEVLRSQLSAANVARGRRHVCYDSTGVGAAKLAFVLSLLGHDDVAVYDGGWSEWGDRLDLPVER